MEVSTVGVFDSGIGGVSVLRELALRFPFCNFVYLGDTARLPYGTKSPETIRKYSEQNLNFLIQKNVQALVIACNSASAQMPEESFMGRPLYNVIVPGAKKALACSQSKKIGILGTRATIQSQAYQKLLLSLDPEVQTFPQACPLLVPLAEEGWLEDPVTNLIVFRYIHPLLAYQLDTLILGCTHYPLLSKAIQNAIGKNVQLIDSGSTLASLLEQTLTFKKLESKGKIDIFCTDLNSQFMSLALRLLPDFNLHFQLADLS